MIQPLNELASDLHKRNVNKGFYDDYVDIDEILNSYADSADDKDVDAKVEKLRKSLRRMQANEKLLLLISEVIEVVEYWRKSGDKLPANSEMVQEEYADVFIRLMDSVAFNDIDIDEAIKNKMEKNNSRPYKHGVKF